MRAHVIMYIILVCLLYFPLAGQDFRQESAVESVESVDQPARNLWWVTCGRGEIIFPETFYDFDLVYLGISFNPAKVPWLLITMRSVNPFSWIMGGDCWWSVDAADISVLIGAITREKYARVSLSSGIGYTYINYRYKYISYEDEDFTMYEYEYEDRYTVGLTFELQAFVTLTSWFGLGLVSFANINFKESGFGGALCVQLGRLLR